jgi:integrase
LRVPLTAPALAAVEALPPRVDTPLIFPASQGGHIGLDTWRTREWYPALEAAGLNKRDPYALRHTFATERSRPAFDLRARPLMGTSVAMIDRTYGHFARDSEAQSVRASRRGPLVLASKWRQKARAILPAKPRMALSVCDRERWSVPGSNR